MRRLILVAVVLVVVLGIPAGGAQAAPGDLDLSFGGGDGKVTTDFGGYDGAGDVALQPDGKIVVAGGSDNGNEFALARYNADGSDDTSFGGGDGSLTTDFGSGFGSGGAVAVQPDGTIIAASNGDGDFILARYTSDGFLDTTFGGGDGVVQTNFGGVDGSYEIVLQADGKILIGGEGDATDDFAIARYNADGTLDTGFGGGDGKVTTDFGGEDVVSGLAVQSDGKIVATGGGGSEYDFALARYSASGALDTGFGGGDGVATLDFGSFDYASGVALQPDGKIVLAGGGDDAGKMVIALVRYTASGSLDTGFGGGDGIVMNDLGAFGSSAHDLVLQADGRIVVGGDGGDSGDDLLIARYDPSGSLDTTFGDGDGSVAIDIKGDLDYAAALALQPDGNIVAAGATRSADAVFPDDDFVIARFLGGGSPPPEEEPPTEEPPVTPPALPPASSPPVSNVIAPAPTPSTHPKRRKCKRGFKKRRVRGKTRCVKKKKSRR